MAFMVAVTAVPVYIVLAAPSSSSPCGSTAQGSPPLVRSLGEPPFGFEYVNSTRVGGTYWYNFTFVPLPANLTASQLTLRVTLPNGSNVTGVREYILWQGTSQVVATANGSTSVWTEGASVILQIEDILTVVSVGSFAGDKLVGMIPLPCGLTGTAWVQIG